MNLYPQYWPLINDGQKPEAVSLLACAKRAEVPQAVDNLLLKPVVRIIITSKVLQDLHENNFPQEVQKVVNYLLMEGRAEFISVIKTRKIAGNKGLNYAAKFCMLIAYEETMALSREIASAQDVDMETRLSALSSLVRSSFGDENKDFIASQLKCMDLKKLANSIEKMDIDVRMRLAGIYYYLGDQEACRFHFLDFLKEIAKLESSEHLRRSLIKKILADFQQLGLGVKSIADLQALDPLELFKIIGAPDKKKVERKMAPS